MSPLNTLETNFNKILMHKLLVWSILHVIPFNNKILTVVSNVAAQHNVQDELGICYDKCKNYLFVLLNERKSVNTLYQKKIDKYCLLMDMGLWKNKGKVFK